MKKSHKKKGKGLAAEVLKAVTERRDPVTAVTDAMDVNKEKRTDTIGPLVKILTKEFGSSIVRLSDKRAYEPVRYVIRTPIQELNEALGTGGIPLEKLITIAGPQSIGKSTFCKAVAAWGQNLGVLDVQTGEIAGKVVPYVQDAENAGMAEFDSGLGLNLDEGLTSRPTILETAFGQLNGFIAACKATKRFGLAIVDSVTAMKPEKESEFDMDESAGYTTGRAKFLSEKLPDLVELLKGSRVSVIIVNQLRQNLKDYGADYYEPGGEALRFYPHMKLWLSPVKQIERSSVVVGNKVKFKVIKSKLAPPLRTTMLEIYFSPPIVTGPKKGIED